MENRGTVVFWRCEERSFARSIAADMLLSAKKLFAIDSIEVASKVQAFERTQQKAKVASIIDPKSLSLRC